MGACGSAVGACGSGVGARRSTHHSLMYWLIRKNLTFPFDRGELGSSRHFSFVSASIFPHKIDRFRTVVKT